MALDGINGIHQKNIEKIDVNNEQNSTKLNHLLEFAERNYNSYQNEPSDAKIKTEVFKNEIMSKLSTSQSKKTKYYLDKLVEAVQELNGVQKNNLKPNGTQEQNKMYNLRIQERVAQMKDFAEMVGCGLNIVQDSKTGLYKLCINNKLFDVPERKVEIVTVETDDGPELLPEITD